MGWPAAHLFHLGVGLGEVLDELPQLLSEWLVDDVDLLGRR